LLRDAVRSRDRTTPRDSVRCALPGNLGNTRRNSGSSHKHSLQRKHRDEVGRRVRIWKVEVVICFSMLHTKTYFVSAFQGFELFVTLFS
jgi:hypothetical protein